MINIEKDDDNHFVLAKPIWVLDRENDMNLTVGFRAKITNTGYNDVSLKIATSGLYRFYVNGIFAGHGPARGPHGYYRMDVWEISKLLTQDENIIAIEVVGYNVNSYYLLDQPSFIQAEIISGQDVLAETSDKSNSFDVIILNERIQRVQRYSVQRTFVEAYNLSPDYQNWHYDRSIKLQSIAECAECLPKKIISRNVSYPDFNLMYPERIYKTGNIITGVKPEEYWRDISITDIGPKLKGYKEEDIDLIISDRIQELQTISSNSMDLLYNKNEPLRLCECTYAIMDFSKNTTGFIGCNIKCIDDAEVYFVFDEILTNDDIDFKRLYSINIVSYKMKKGNYNLETIEPYTLRYLKIIVTKGNCEVSDIHLREYTNPDTNNAFFKCDNNALNVIYSAGKETFNQNAIDIYMDCPSRERAGWLCDSFFTSRVEYYLTGKSKVEKNFFENYLLAEEFKYLPDGMLPMCYPADHYNGLFIPNWALWFIIQLEEYYKRSGDNQLVEKLRPKVDAVFRYFLSFKNEYGLLEKLDSWIFVEWSKANDFVQDINYPTNMLYAAALSAAGRLYEDTQLADEAESIRKEILKQSFNGEFFVDNAIRENGVIKITDNVTEVCQYYAFYFGIATPQSHKKLWNILLNDFGPNRDLKAKYSKVYPANAFIGNYLRLELLSINGYSNMVLEQMEKYFLYMGQKTGTLWEHTGDYASCNHGFASHVVYSLYRDALGVQKIDNKNRLIELRFNDINLEWCKGELPIEDKAMYLKWWKDGENIYYCVKIPENYDLKIYNMTGCKLIRCKNV